MTMTIEEMLNAAKGNATVTTTAPVVKTVKEVCSDAGYQKHSKRAGMVVFVAKLNYQIKDWQGLNQVAKAVGGTYIPKGYIESDKEKTGFWFETQGQLNTFLNIHKNHDWELKQTAEEAKQSAEAKRMDKLAALIAKASGRDELERMKALIDASCVAIDSKTNKTVVDVPVNKNAKPSIVLKPVINKQ